MTDDRPEEHDPITRRFILAGVSLPTATALAAWVKGCIEAAVILEKQMQAVVAVVINAFSVQTEQTKSIAELLQEVAEIEIDPPKTKLQQYFASDRRRADRERERVRFKYIEWRSLIATRIYKPP